MYRREYVGVRDLAVHIRIRHVPVLLEKARWREMSCCKASI
jgi:hypothetical protein